MKHTTPQPKPSAITTAIRSVLGLTVLATSSPLWAQQLQLEEVVVSAQKRVENLQDVPIAVTAVSGEKIDQAAIRDLPDLVDYIPNVSMVRNAGGGNPARISIRGIGSGNNLGFEQSVGLFVDGVYTGRGNQFMVPFLDVGTVEVLRGPQGALFGKNTVAGAMIINSARPTDELEGQLRAQYETEYGGTRYFATVSGPLSENLSGRLAATVQDDEGFIDNLITGAETPNIASNAVRGSLLWDASDSVQVYTKLEYQEQEVTGGANQLTLIDGVLLGAVPHRLLLSPLEDGVFDDKNTIDSWNEEGGDADGVNAVVQVEWDLATDVSLTSITAYSQYDASITVDPDVSDLRLLERTSSEKFDQLSQEIRITATPSSNLDYTAGIYLETQTLEANIPVSASLIPLSFLNIPQLPPIEWGTSSPFEQDATTAAVFGEFNWQFAEQWSLRAGIRYADDNKEARLQTIVTERGSLAPTSNPLLIGFAGALLDFENALIEDEDSWGNVSWSANLVWDYSDLGMAYFRAARGFKSGGFSIETPNGDPDEFAFDQEQADSLEIGTKMVLLGGAAELNIAAFYTEMQDLQVSAFQDNRFVVGNAAESTSKGIEFDGRWILSENFDIVASLAYLDSTFDDYPGAPCTFEQVTAPDPAAAGCDPVTNSTNLSGEVAGRAPEWSGSLVTNFSYPITPDLGLRASVDLLYEDEINPRTNPNFQGAYTKVNARISLASNKNGWDIALVGRNLTDELTFATGGGVPLFTGSWLKAAQSPRTLAVEGTYRF